MSPSKPLGRVNRAGFAVVADEVKIGGTYSDVDKRKLRRRLDAIRESLEEAVESMTQVVTLVDNGVRRAGDANEAIRKWQGVQNKRLSW